VITVDTKLEADVGPCPDGGLVVGADHVVLDLNGYTVFGTDDNGDGIGIAISGRTGATVTNGTVMRFDAGVYIESGGGGNEVSHLEVVDNVSSTQGRFGPDRTLSFGDGIVLNSNDNVIRHNTVRRNGPNDGIGVFANSGGNTIRGNVVTDNDVPTGPHSNFDDGIRLESGAHDNLVLGNIVKRSGRTGIAVFAYGGGNVITANIVRSNGTTSNGGRRSGTGIRLYAGNTGTVVRDNRSFANRTDGIRVDGRSNLITGNRTGGNGAGGRGYDLHDSNLDPPCDDNTWSGNAFDTAFPDCTKGEPSTPRVRGMRPAASIRA
jgi:parallel beta-helix repeat protein